MLRNLLVLMSCVLLTSGAGCGGGVAPPAGDDETPTGGGSGSGTGGSGGGTPTGGGGSGGSGGSGGAVPFSAMITVRPDVFSLFEGDLVRLGTTVEGARGEVDYQWSVAPAHVAELEDPMGAAPLLTALAAGSVTVTLVATDLATSQQLMDQRTLRVETNEIAAPDDALVRACSMVTCELQVFQVGSIIELIPEISGTQPVSIEWIADPDNVLAADQVQLTHLEEGMATIRIPDLFLFPYELRFSVVATYENGSTLSDVMLIRKL